MIGRFLLFIAFWGLVVACPLSCGQKEKPLQEIQITWTPNSEPDMLYYRLFWWHGSDSASCPFVYGDSSYRYTRYFVKDVPHQVGVDQMEILYKDLADGGWVRAALTAVDKNGNESPLAVSNFLRLSGSAENQRSFLKIKLP